MKIPRLRLPQKLRRPAQVDEFALRLVVVKRLNKWAWQLYYRHKPGWPLQKGEKIHGTYRQALAHAQKEDEWLVDRYVREREAARRQATIEQAHAEGGHRGAFKDCVRCKIYRNGVNAFRVSR